MKIVFVDDVEYSNGSVYTWGDKKAAKNKEDMIWSVINCLGIAKDQDISIVISEHGYESCCIVDAANNKFCIIINQGHIKHIFSEFPFFINLGLKTFKEKFAFILAHELQHVLQYKNGSMKQSPDLSHVIWKDQVRVDAAEKDAARKRMLGVDVLAYHKLPWEHDANTVAESVTSTLFPKKKPVPCGLESEVWVA